MEQWSTKVTPYSRIHSSLEEPKIINCRKYTVGVFSISKQSHLKKKTICYNISQFESRDLSLRNRINEKAAVKVISTKSPCSISPKWNELYYCLSEARVWSLTSLLGIQIGLPPHHVINNITCTCFLKSSLRNLKSDVDNRSLLGDIS